MPIARVRDEEPEPEEQEEDYKEPNPVDPSKKFYGWVQPFSGPYKGRRIAVYKRGTSGVHGLIDSTEEDVYVFFYELKRPERRIRE